MASCVIKMCTKNYQNWITLLQVMVKKFGVFFMSHNVDSYTAHCCNFTSRK